MKEELVKKALKQLHKFDKTDDINDLEKYTDTLVIIAKNYNVKCDILNDLLLDIVTCENKLMEYLG